jgi:DNA-binding XRE family transcriptional regulator
VAAQSVCRSSFREPGLIAKRRLRTGFSDARPDERSRPYPIGHISPKEYSHAVGVASEDICVRVGRRIRKLRKERGWTQDYLAIHTGLGRTFISNIERGKKEPCLRSLEILALGFEMSLSQFMRGL